MVQKKGGVAFDIHYKSTVPKLPQIKIKRIHLRARTTGNGRVCIIKSRYHNIGVILIFIMSFNIEDTSIIFHSNKLYASWLAVTSSCLISTKTQRFEENVSFNKIKKLSTQRPRTARSTYVIESTLPKDFKQKTPIFFNNQLFYNIIIFLMKRIRKYKCNDRGDLCMH